MQGERAGLRRSARSHRLAAMPSRSEPRRLAAVLFTDIVGSTEVAAEIGDARWRALLDRHLAIVRRELKRFGGRLNDTAGDGVFATFERPTEAIRCAVALTDAVRELGTLCRERRIGLRLMIIPELHSPGSAYPFRDVHEAVSAAARREGIPVVDLLPAFAGADPPSLWVSRGDAHPNARAHRIIADALYEEIARGAPERRFNERTIGQ